MPVTASSPTLPPAVEAALGSYERRLPILGCEKATHGYIVERAGTPYRFVAVYDGGHAKGAPHVAGFYFTRGEARANLRWLRQSYTGKTNRFAPKPDRKKTIFPPGRLAPLGIGRR